MTETTEEEIRTWVQRHFPYVRLVRTQTGFDTYGFRYSEEITRFRRQFTRSFEQYFSTNQSGRRLPSSVYGHGR